MAKLPSDEKCRGRMRLGGFRLVQFWVSDVRARGFKNECRRQSRAAAASTQTEQEVMEWIEATSDTEGWTASGLG